MIAPHVTVDELAEVLGKTRRAILELATKENWPRVVVGRTTTFTDEQAAQIIAQHTRGGSAPAKAAISGQTARSARRAS